VNEGTFEHRVKRIKDIIRRIKSSTEAATNLVSKVLKTLEREGLIREDIVPERPPGRIAGVDGSFRSFTAFVRPLTIVKVTIAIQEGNKLRALGPYDGDHITIYYEDDVVIEEESLKMLSDEAMAAIKALRVSDFVLIDGPFVNPPKDIRIESEAFKVNLRNRIELIRSRRAAAIVKRIRRGILTRDLPKIDEELREMRKVSEAVLLIKVLEKIREDRYSGPIVIGPFGPETISYEDGSSESLYQRYVQRSPMHKPVVLETSTDSFPTRLLNEDVRINDRRASIPNVLQLAHELSRITDEESRAFYNMFYRVLRWVSEGS